MTNKSQPNFPKELFVWEIQGSDNDEDNFRMNSDTVDDAEDGPVAVYELKRVGTKETTYSMKFD